MVVVVVSAVVAVVHYYSTTTTTTTTATATVVTSVWCSSIVALHIRTLEDGRGDGPQEEADLNPRRFNQVESTGTLDILGSPTVKCF